MTATWQAYHQITGAPLTDDDAPSTTAPDAARIFKAPHTVEKVLVQLLDGTSATAAVWTCDDGDDPTDKDNWSALAGATGAIGTTLPLPLAVTAGAYITIRLTSVVGSPTACVVLDFACFPDILKALCTRSALSIDSATLHADVDGVEALIGTTNTALGTLHTDCGTTLHNDLNTTIHTDLATTLGGKLDTLHTDLNTTLHGDVDGVEGLLGIIRDDGLFTVVHDAEVVATSDGNGNPLTIQAKTGGISGSVVQTVTFTYDGNGNEASRARS
jgi:hypothetical protein